uniref:Uncharacterized protein n=1 Tax=Rhizophora mucronata TaxID=61149 RepID=A0A2P2NLR2_RHIMU
MHLIEAMIFGDSSTQRECLQVESGPTYYSSSDLSLREHVIHEFVVTLRLISKKRCHLIFTVP